MSLVDWCLLHLIRTSLLIPRSFPSPILEREQFHIVSTHNAFIFLLERTRKPKDVMQRFGQSLVELWLTHDFRCRRWLGHHIESTHEWLKQHASYADLYRRYAPEMHLYRLDNNLQHSLVRELSDPHEDVLARAAESRDTRTAELLLIALEERALCCIPVGYHMILFDFEEQSRRLFRVEGLVVSPTSYCRYLDSPFRHELLDSDGFDHEVALSILFHAVSTLQATNWEAARDDVVAAVPPWKSVVISYTTVRGANGAHLDAFVVETARRLHAKGCLDIEKSLLGNGLCDLVRLLSTLDYSEGRLAEMVRNTFVEGGNDFTRIFERSIVQRRVVALMELDPKLRKLFTPLLPLCPSSERSIQNALNVFV